MKSELTPTSDVDKAILIGDEYVSDLWFLHAER